MRAARVYEERLIAHDHAANRCLSHHTGQAVIVVYGEHSGPFGRPECEFWAICQFRSPIAQIRRSRRFGTIAIAGRVRWGGREPRRRQPPYRKSSGGQVAAHHSQRDRIEVPNRPSQRPGSVLAEGRRRCCSRSVDPRVHRLRHKFRTDSVKRQLHRHVST